MLRSSALLLACVTVLALAAGCGGGGTPATSGASPVITSIEPASGGMAGGTPIVIRGTNLANPRAGEYAVLIGGQPADEIVVVSDTEVECRSPSGADGPADVEVITIEGESVATGAFTFHPPPTVASITPDKASRDGGTPVTVKGTGFAANDPGKTICLIELKALTDLVVVDDTTLTGLTPSSWTEIGKDVTVVNRNGSGTLPRGWTYVGPIPQIYSITPTEGPRTGGTAVTVTGDFFTEAGGDVTIRFGDAEAVVGPYIDDQTRTCTTPLSATPGWKDVTVGNNNGESTLPHAFYYIPAPELESVVPDEGSLVGGTAVTITGQGYTALGAGTTALTFGGAFVTNMVIVNDTTITCDTPPGSAIGAVDIVILNGNGTDTLPGAFTYTAPCWWETPFGTAQSHTDDSSRVFSFGSVTFPFYGTTYSSFYANSNGSLTAGSWTSYSSNILSTYNQIAGCQRDLYPPSGGTIYYKNLSDRTVVTYDNIPPLGGSGLVKLQIHLIDTGMVCVLYNGMTVSTTYYCGINPGLGGTASTTADLSSASGNSGSSSSTIIESFGSFDLNNGFTMFVPDGSGGYNQSYVGIIP